MTRARRAATIMEVLLAFALSTIVLGGVMVMWSSVNTMARASDLSAALLGASLALAQIESDVRTSVARPDAASTVLVSDKRVAMVRGDAAPDGTVSGRAVVYEKEVTPTGELRLRRTAGSDAGYLPGRYRAVAMALVNGPGGPYLRVKLTVAAGAGATPSRPASGEADAVTLLRVGGHDLRGSASFDASFLDAVKAVALP